MALDPYRLWQYNDDPLALFTSVMAELEKPENAALKLGVEQGIIAYTDVPEYLLNRLATTHKEL